MRTIFIIGVLLFFRLSTFGQFQKPKSIQPDSSNYTNVYVKKIFSDDKSSVFMIWVKKEVALHYHQNHTEVVVVMDGKGIMSLGESEQVISKGDVIVIPSTTPHSVITTSKKPLKVMSIQSPHFDGTDRVLVK